MDIVGSIKQQIDNGETRINQGIFTDFEILNMMKEEEIDIRYWILYKILVDQYINQNDIDKFADSDHPWALIQDNHNIRFLHNCIIDIHMVRPEKIIGLTSLSLYKFLFGSILKNQQEPPDEFINHYVNIVDNETRMLWYILDIAIYSHLLKCFLKIIKIKPLVFAESRDYYDDDFVNNVNESKSDILSEYFPDVNNIDNMSVTDIFDTKDVKKYTIREIMKMFNSLSMSEQIKFGSSIRQCLSDKELLDEICDTLCRLFVDFAFDNYPIAEWFDKYYNEINISSYFGKKLLATNSKLKDKIMFRALRNSRVITLIFPDITQYDVIRVIHKAIENQL